MTDSLDPRWREAPEALEPDVADDAPVTDSPAAQPAPAAAVLTTDAQPAGPAEPAPPRRRWPRIALMLIVPLIVLGVGAYLYLTSGTSVSTDNAYVQQNKVSISADVGGRIVEVAVRENQHVNKGDLLFRIDPAPYRIALQQANAAIANAQVQVQTLGADYRAQLPDIAIAREGVASAQETFNRQAELMKQGFTTRAQYEAAQHALAEARAQVASAEGAAAAARAKLATSSAAPGENPAVALAKAQRDQAQLNLARTEVRAPVSGTISQSDRLQVGNMLVNGLPAVSIVADGGGWVEANFKETDLNRMRVGQRAEVQIDAYRGLKLRGHVASIGAGTGSEFSVLPAQNASGNWVKVTQRVPVRIAIDENSPRELIAGLSANVRVFFGG